VTASAGQAPPPADVHARRLAAVQRAVKSWVSQLMDLTGRNQLLFYRALKRGTLELTEASATSLQMLLSGRVVRLSQLLPDTVEEPARLADAVARAQTVHKKALTLFEERGIQTLYLAWGMARWTTHTSGATPCAPVLLRPLQFKPRGAAEADFEVVLEGDWDVNATLLHLLAHDYKLRIEGAALLDLLPASTGAPDPQALFARLCKETADVEDFHVVPRVVAGTFTYTKLPMVEDLRGSLEQLAGHDLIAAIAGDEDAIAAVRALHARDVDLTLPDHTPPADEFLILDADASQSYAINAAIAGEPLVVIGPPGTGKSQTIANLIASYTARGKRVLFVAEKRAAIDAVTKRLHAVGLDDLVMDLHGGVTSKRQLAADLASALQRIGQVPAVDVADVHLSLTHSRDVLNNHADAVHETRLPWGVSLWQVQDRLSDLPARACGNMAFHGADLLRLDADTVRQARDALQEWADLAEPLRDGRSLWAHATVTTEGDAQRAHQIAVHTAGDAVPAARTLLDNVLTTTGLPAPDSVAGWRSTLAMLNGLTAVLAVLTPQVWDEDLAALVAALAPGGCSVWARMTAQLFNSDYRAAKRVVAQVWRDEGKPGGREAHAVVVAARDSHTEWLALGGRGTPVVPHNLDAATGAYSSLTDDLAALGAFLTTYDLASRSHHAIAADAERLAADQATVFRLPRLHKLRSWLTDLKCAPLLDAVQGGALAPDDIVAAFDYAWLTSIRAHLTATDPRLASFDGRVHSRHVEQFVASDRRHIDTTADRVRRCVAEQAVAALDAFEDQEHTVVAQSKRKRGHMTLRQLFDAAPDVLTSLRPCWVMSPLVVSQTLPALPIFDVVVFDEASQVTPADAVPALLRARQAVVAGDDRQLPPTAFFGSSDDDGDEDDNEDGAPASLASGYESVLDVLSVLLRQYMLRWHYRSEDERLIAFSNVNIYGSSLTTFPGVTGSGCLAHELIPHRPGVRVDTRSNDDEVARVVELMIDHARDRPHESLGVIAMGIHHATRIEALLRSRIADERDPRLDQFFDESVEERAFVKNLERVQGDERDAIILTIGYAKNPDGRMVYRFGPLNSEGGERRLNVAVSRARRRLTLVSSFSHTDMDPARMSAKGAQLLRAYVKYVESGGADLGGAEQDPPLNAFELAIQSALERGGLKVIPQYGAGGFRLDFAICHPERPGEFVLAVEADGAAYHGSPTARDRDRLRQQILERLGWTFHRIWSTDWFNDPQRETQKVLDAYKAALAADRACPARRVTSQVPPRPVAPSWPKEQTSQASARTAARPRIVPGFPITDYRHADLVALARWIKSDTLLRTEEQMLTEMMSELGFKKRGSRIVNALTRAIQSAG
jgi:very-short-patch-repair endonuclease